MKYEISKLNFHGSEFSVGTYHPGISEINIWFFHADTMCVRITFIWPKDKYVGCGTTVELSDFN